MLVAWILSTKLLNRLSVKYLTYLYKIYIFCGYLCIIIYHFYQDLKHNCKKTNKFELRKWCYYKCKNVMFVLAIAAHKFVITFCVCVELMQSGTKVNSTQHFFIYCNFIILILTKYTSSFKKSTKLKYKFLCF